MSTFEKYSFFIFVLICLAMTASAQVSYESQPKRPMNSICMSAGGGATYISCEYERLFGRGKIFFLAAGAGLGTAISDDEKQYVTSPFHFSGNVGKGASFFEFGFGRTFLFNHPERDGTSYVILGYRLALPAKHKFAFSFRLNLDIPFKYINVVGEGDPMFIPAGLGLGIAF